MGVLIQILGLIACLSFLVITHELGHYAFARIFHTRVDKFYMFFNPHLSIIRAKKYNGKWHVRFFAPNVLERKKVMLDESGDPIIWENDEDPKTRKKFSKKDPLSDKEWEEIEEKYNFGRKITRRHGHPKFTAIEPEDLPLLADDDWRKYPDQTEWGIGWLPLGGYCSINGMVDETTHQGSLSTNPHPWEFRSKPAWQRLFIILGGVLVNFVTALVLYAVIAFTWGDDYIPVENAKYGMHFSEAAVKAGFQQGDKIIFIDSVKPKDIPDITSAVLINGAKRVVVERLVDSLAINEDGTCTVVKTIPMRKTIYLAPDFANKVIGSEKAEQYFCQFEMPFIIDSVPSDSPAALAGFQKGDTLIGVDGKTIFSFYEFQKYFFNHKNSAVQIAYVRGGKTDTAAVKLNEDGKIVVYPRDPYTELGYNHVDYSFLQSIPAGISKGFNTLVDYVKQFKLVFSKEGATQIGGFGTIGSIFPKVWDWQRFWTMTAFLAIILAFMNVLPIPALDGGYILFILIEMITRRKLSDKFIGYANMVGMILLFALLIYANGLDIIRLFK